MRSLLFVPGDSERKLAKSLDSGADALILDLEDSVTPEAKPKARTMTRDFLKSARAKAKRPRLLVRTNALPTGLVDHDLEAVVAARPDGIMLPKCESAADVVLLDAKLSVAEALAGVEDGASKIFVIVTETAASLFGLGGYAGASARLDGLTWGAEDLSADVGSIAIRHADSTFTDPYRLASALCLFAAAAARVMPIDSVYANFQDLDGLRADAEAGNRDGFVAKMAIHPGQVSIINEIFTPTKSALEWARGVLAAFAANPGAGVLSYRGEMIDKPHIDRAERLLARAKSLGLV